MRMKNESNRIYADYRPLEDVIAELREAAKGMTEPCVIIEDYWDSFTLVVSGQVPMTEEEERAAVEADKTTAVRQRQAQEEQLETLKKERPDLFE